MSSKKARKVFSHPNTTQVCFISTTTGKENVQFRFKCQFSDNCINTFSLQIPYILSQTLFTVLNI